MTIVRAAVVAGALSGVPSTMHTLLTGGDPLESTRAAGAIVVPAASPRGLLMAGALVHATLCLGWTAVLDRLLPRRRSVPAGAAVGLLIAALDLGLAQRLFPRVAALPLAPQLADHVAFGVVVAAGLRGRKHCAQPVGAGVSGRSSIKH